MDRDNLVAIIEDHIPVYKLRAESEQTSMFILFYYIEKCFLQKKMLICVKFRPQDKLSKIKGFIAFTDLYY